MSRNVLVVDDSPSMRQMVSFTLRQSGFEVVEGADGKQGLAAAQANKVDLVISDLNMPEMDGIEMIRQIRGLPAYKFTPILMLTTESREEKKQAGKAAGATGWLVKPFDPERLMQVVGKVLP